MKHYDVVVIGGGPGGLAAAARAAETGASVALLETLDWLGGNASLSTGYLACVGTQLQKDLGIADSVTDFMADCAAQYEREKHNGPLIWDPVLTEAYAKESAKALDTLLELGVDIQRVLPKPSQHRHDRMHAIDDPAEIGRAYTKRLDALGVDVHFETKALRLITQDGRVTGVTAEHADGSPRSFGATKGVILTTGGYQGNYELRRRHQREDEINGYLSGVATCGGMGHVAGAALGADLINMDYIQPMVVIPSLLAEDAIAVNRAGERFHDETGKYSGRVAALAAQDEGFGYYIIDAETRALKADLVEKMPEPAVTCDTLDALAHRIGVDAGNLTDTVASWNAFLKSDLEKDPLFGRMILPKERRALGTPPYSALRMVRSTTFTWGGMAVTTDMQVVNVLGEPIPGLFAAGDAIGGINVVSGMGGVHIAAALALGGVAGEKAVTGPQAAPHLTAPAQARDFVTTQTPRMALFDLEDRG
ncbi:FAD-dependent oxidoreductase [Celeribacter naphthalenivorans]|uniref:FAD-dependent oxidoreductase n=1 Tax=Celeribacter naphthalenivorans TaxID=1614694 RepID=UPI001CFAC22F|nr:FAD-dependent oxidoreductase [Celeribacter naphthalenivorans]